MKKAQRPSKEFGFSASSAKRRDVTLKEAVRLVLLFTKKVGNLYF